MKHFTFVRLSYALPILFLVGCAANSNNPVADELPQARDPLSTSFKALGQAGLERLQQDDTQRICSEYEGRELPTDLMMAIIKSSTDSVVFPADGNFMGDWETGKKIAETGTGLQSNDDPSIPNGGNCYACHQMAPDEFAYGTLGLPLVNYGKLRGTSEAILKYTWTRLWNSHAYNACSHMPRFGANGVLSEQQLKDVMAFLFDPKSPVNKEVAVQ
ncbi:MAG: sulfur oxidation c-type cytochrome SoxX [Aquimonas sp.]|jgi:L-cysteine S-thiosulfotransferase|nr:sulfur oxidation c-type cytochrome SoxX [Aquimonas sp.]